MEGEFEFDNLTTSLVSYGYDRFDKSSLNIDNKKETNFITWFSSRPIISFNNDDINLVYGSPDYRRKFLDLICSQIDVNYLTSLISYKHWINSRNILLTSNFNNFQCDIYDEKIAESGSYILTKRFEIFNEIISKFRFYFNEITESNFVVDVRYEAFIDSTNFSINECKNVFYKHLYENRNRDLKLGFTSIGPHRDNFNFLLQFNDAKKFCSQGQNRAIALSFKLAIGDLLCSFCKEKIIYLIDDTVAELDVEKTQNVFPLIEGKGQIFFAVPKGKSFLSKSYQSIDL